MKPLIKLLLVAFSLSIVTLSASLAEINPTRPTAVASYKTGIYTTVSGKLSIALDKETTGSVDIRFKNAEGKVLFSQHVGKNEKAYRIRFDIEELPDGDYQIDITNGLETTKYAMTISTNQPSTSSRLVAIN